MNNMKNNNILLFFLPSFEHDAQVYFTLPVHLSLKTTFQVLWSWTSFMAISQNSRDLETYIAATSSLQFCCSCLGRWTRHVIYLPSSVSLLCGPWFLLGEHAHHSCPRKGLRPYSPRISKL